MNWIGVSCAKLAAFLSRSRSKMLALRTCALEETCGGAGRAPGSRATDVRLLAERRRGVRPIGLGEGGLGLARLAATFFALTLALAGRRPLPDDPFAAPLLFFLAIARPPPSLSHKQLRRPTARQ